MPRLWHLIAIALLVAGTPWPSSAAGRGEWVTLTDCQYVAAKDNDGDSFRVRCGDKGFVLRLYFVDAPEPTLSYPERAREQGAQEMVPDTIYGPSARFCRVRIALLKHETAERRSETHLEGRPASTRHTVWAFESR